MQKLNKKKKSAECWSQNMALKNRVLDFCKNVLPMHKDKELTRFVGSTSKWQPTKEVNRWSVHLEL